MLPEDFFCSTIGSKGLCFISVLATMWSFALEKSTGLKSYILSARELSIALGYQPMYWSWKFMYGSRLSEVAELRTIWWLEIHGKIGTQTLSPNTTYGAYLIMKISHRAYGLDPMPSEVYISVGDCVLDLWLVIHTAVVHLQLIDELI
ncbi:F-box protein PP2-B15 [Camellia lanceoleosa]|uniref:F-box protein PP2-B15 n=1 Tax=Camellia lanceoleosa TaxID=1840588 RepID=A0ACC0G7I6_9ERIC|nr:F-box protein PP2-B15 [Camellia lanceoleosa]